MIGGQRDWKELGRGLRRTLQWHFTQGVSKPLAPQILNKIKREVRRRHKINYRSAYVLLKVESGDSMAYYTNINSPWMARLSQTKECLENQEELRLQGAQLERPNTKWTSKDNYLLISKSFYIRNLCKSDLGVFLLGFETNTKSYLLTLTMTIFAPSGA